MWTAWWLALAGVVTILYLLPNAGPPGTANIDKLTHCAAFLCLGFAGRLAETRPGAIALPVNMLLAVVLEWLQSFVPGREASVLDAVANLAGLAIGIAAALAFRSLILRRHAAAQ